METPIGRRLRTSPARRAASGLVASVVVGIDTLLVWRGVVAYTGVRAVVPALGLAAYLILAGGDLASVGLALRPIQGVRYWVRASAKIGAAIGGVVLAVAMAFVLLGRDLPIDGVPLAFVPASLVRMCVAAPLVEEATYRLGLCTAAVVLFESSGTVALGGLLFGGLHVLYGNPGPDNLVAGFFLAWAYLKSGTIVVPLALHALGNLCVLAAWVGLWYWRSGALL